MVFLRLFALLHPSLLLLQAGPDSPVCKLLYKETVYWKIQLQQLCRLRFETTELLSPASTEL